MIINNQRTIGINYQIRQRLCCWSTFMHIKVTRCPTYLISRLGQYPCLNLSYSAHTYLELRNVADPCPLISTHIALCIMLEQAEQGKAEYPVAPAILEAVSDLTVIVIGNGIQRQYVCPCLPGNSPEHLCLLTCDRTESLLECIP